MEGYALTPVHVIPLLHAWNLDADGLLIDATWATPGLAYLGVAFNVGRADDATWNGDACVLDDWRRGWPVFQQEWAGEDWQREWEPSSALLFAKQFGARGSRR